MPEKNKRRCSKCASLSTDPGIVLYRFPKPGIRNILRCELWTKYLFPESSWSSREYQNTLYHKHIMLCHKHFKQTSFIDYEQKKLHRHAVPDAECDEVESNIAQSDFAIPGPSHPILFDVTNVRSKEVHVQVQVASVGDIPPCPSFAQSKENIPCLDNAIPQSSTFKTDEKVKKDQQTKKLQHYYKKSRQYLKRICQLRNTLKKSKSLKHRDVLRVIMEEADLHKQSKKTMSPTFAALLQAQLRNAPKKPKGRRWTTEDKIIALRLYKRSPTCYKLLRRLFCLPAQSSLKRILGNFEMRPGINKKILVTIKKYIDKQKPSDNQFVLMFDEMNIRKHLHYNKKTDEIEGYQDHGQHGRTKVEAVKALVFMIAGIRKSVKQPLAYYLSSANVTADRLMVLIKETLHACFDMGLNVTATVCDMAGTNRRALATLGATESIPIMTIQNREVVAIFDAPHLLKCFRNMFLKYNIKCKTDISSSGTSGEGIAKWSDIKDFYTNDSANPNFVYAPALKKDHLDPNNKQKMKVNLAAQILSSSVAGGMFAQISQGLLPASATVTANVVLKMDKLFDLCNSSSPDLRRGKMCSTNMSSTSPHVKFFTDMKIFFKDMRFIECPRTPPSIEGWIWTINGLEIIWNNIKNEFADVKSLATRRLQQDPIENLFGCIRSNCGSNSNPTTSGFVGGLKTAVLSNMAHVTSGNCEDDKNEAIIGNFKNLLSTHTSKVKETSSASPLETLFVSSFDVNAIADDVVNLDSPEVQACAYVCGYLIKQHKNVLNNCVDCKKIFVAQEPNIFHNFVENKEYNQLKNALNYASQDLVVCVEKCALVTNALLSNEPQKRNLKNYVIEKIPQEIFNFLKMCACHYHENVNYLKGGVFHICVHRYCTIKNRTYAEEGTRIALQKKIKILKNK